MIQQHIPQEAAKTVDYLSFAGAVGVFFGWIPTIVGIATLVWTCIRIWETSTVQNLVKRFRKDK